MNKSESITKLASAMEHVQAEMPAAPMNATNPFLKNKYADLGSIIETAKPVIARHGISVVQFPVSEPGTIGIETVIMHASGEWMSNVINIEATEEKGKSAAQVAGSIISYLRRYSYAAALGMYADEDTDGHAPKAPAKPAPKKAQPKPEDNSIYATAGGSKGLYKDQSAENLRWSRKGLAEAIANFGEVTEENAERYDELKFKLEAVEHYLGEI